MLLFGIFRQGLAQVFPLPLEQVELQGSFLGFNLLLGLQTESLLLALGQGCLQGRPFHLQLAKVLTFPLQFHKLLLVSRALRLQLLLGLFLFDLQGFEQILALRSLAGKFQL